jgi:hypothetical protein
MCARDKVFHFRAQFYFISVVLTRGLGFKVKGRVEKQDCNEQRVQKWDASRGLTERRYSQRETRVYAFLSKSARCYGKPEAGACGPTSILSSPTQDPATSKSDVDSYKICRC